MVAGSTATIASPPPEGVAFFEQKILVDDPAPDAYERLVDRLLASSHFGKPAWIAGIVARCC